MINFVLGVIPLIAVGVIYWIICRMVKADVNSNKYLFILLIVVLGAEWYHFYGLNGSTPSVIGWGFAAVIVYYLFKIRQDPRAIEAAKPKLYMRDDKVVLCIPNVKISSEPSPKDSESHARYDCEYVFDKASVTGDNGIITVSGSGEKTTVKRNDTTEPGSPVNKERFKSKSFRYSIEDIKIIDDVPIEIQKKQ